MRITIKFLCTFFLCMAMCISFWNKPMIAKTLERPSDEEIIQFVKNAFDAQLSLGNQFYTLEEANDIQSSFFTKEYIDLFNEENLVGQNGKYTTYGKDFSLYYIPFFKYEGNTKIAYDEKNNNIFVYELFKATGEGMTMEDHYKTVVISYQNHTMKIKDKFLSDLSPDELHFQYKNYSFVKNYGFAY